MQEEKLQYFILRRSDVDDTGTSCHSTSTRTINVEIDVKGLGRPMEFTGREEDFQQLSKKTEAFFAGVIKEFEMMLEWAAEQTTEITTTAIDLEFLPTDTNEDRGVQNLEQEEGRETFFARSFLRDFALFWNSKRELNAGSPMCRATRRS